MAKTKIVIIVGPTAVGKTALSISLAKHFNGEIISADSIQVYRGLDIGSAKVTPEERGNIAHHLIDVVSPFEEYNAARFAREAAVAIDKIVKANHLPIIVGGTGMYVSSLLFEMGVTCGKDEKYRQELEEVAKVNGSAYLHKMLEEVDPESAKSIHPNHLSRIIRALEIYHLTGKKKSEQKSEKVSKYDYLLIGLYDEREVLYKRINDRVDNMLENGLIDEVKGLISQGLTDKNQSMQGVGYKETYKYLTEGTSREEYVEGVKQASRNYAKRQFTFFKKMPGIVWKKYEEKEDIINMISRFLETK